MDAMNRHSPVTPESDKNNHHQLFLASSDHWSLITVFPHAVAAFLFLLEKPFVSRPF
jgi:hypothetical protein